VLALALGVSSGALAALHRVDPRTPCLLEVPVLIASSLAATATRYVALRVWVFGHAGRRLSRRLAATRGV
jgi:hypothetical protein